MASAAIPKKSRNFQIGDKEVDILNTKGTSAVYNKERIGKEKSVIIKKDPQAVMDFIFGKSDVNPLAGVK